MQVGWADAKFACDPVRGQGVGDHARSWAVDGFRQKRWCLSSTTYGERWHTGDVLGCLLDLELVEMRFLLNGRDLGVAFRGFRVDGLFPAASLNVGQAAHFNFGAAPFLHPPADGLPFKAVGDAPPPDPADAAAAPTRAADAANDARDDERKASAEEDIVAELELRQQNLIENLIGMGFPVEWAIRAAENCDANRGAAREFFPRSTARVRDVVPSSLFSA